MPAVLLAEAPRRGGEVEQQLRAGAGEFLGGTVVMTITLMDQIDWFNDKGDMGGSADWIIKNLVNYTSAGFQSSFIPEPTPQPSA